MADNIVEYFSGHEGYRCGYCKSEDTNYSHGMWAHCMTPAEYEGLLNLGWRRSGKYMYKPTNNRTCCPSYTIKCHALDFRISKSQKKVLKKFNEFLSTGNLKARHHSAGEKSEDPTDHQIVEVINYKEGTATETDNINTENATALSIAKSKRDTVKVTPTSGIPASPKRRKSDAKPQQSLTSTSSQLDEREGKKCLKAKFLRLERKKQKLLARGLDPEEVLLEKCKKAVPKVKEIEEFLGEPVDSKRKLTIKTVRVGSEDFEATFKLEHALYQKYQMKIHNDAESDCTAKQFKRFLCENPFDDSNDDGLGGYHQQYYLGSDQLIAVGVIDILPNCLSSVYFFYDPDFMDLILGTYGALREIGFVRQRNKTHPRFQFYYMGFYIHSCPKMRYKGNFTPSSLLCPETFQWKELDDELKEKLDKTKYTPFFSPSTQQPQADINKVCILYRRNIMPYCIYELQRSKDDTEEIQEYCDLVSEEIASRLCLYRTSY